MACDETFLPCVSIVLVSPEARPRMRALDWARAEIKTIVRARLIFYFLFFQFLMGHK